MDTRIKEHPILTSQPSGNTNDTRTSRRALRPRVDCRAMKFAVFYEMAEDGMSKVMEHYAAHSARLREFHARGVLLMAGPLGNPPEGALSIFTTREAAEEFVQDDPFVRNGVVGQWRIVDWDEALAL